MWLLREHASKIAIDAACSNRFGVSTVGIFQFTMVKRLCIGLMIMGAGACQAEEGDTLPIKSLKLAVFENESPSVDARLIANWVVDSNDNAGLPFIVLDKKDAKVFVFHPDGRLRGAAPALLGLAIGDHSVPGIGERKLSAIRPEERTTPAGRFVASLDHNLHDKEILWVDYDSAISLHPVITSNAKERRAQRLATPTPLDNRISYGCINVPATFFQQVVSAAFAGTNGIVYVLPETRPAKPFFGAYDMGSKVQ
jgi:hypothetical protein